MGSRADILSHELAQFLGYWSALGGGKAIPDRQRLDLRNLTSILRWMFILEMGMDGTLKFRLAGSSLEEAVGCGMTDQSYADIFSLNDGGAITEELYAQCMVKGCGLMRSGTFALGNDGSITLQVLALPFADPRTLGGTVMVGVVRPFDYENHRFQDRRHSFDQNISDLLVIPSPRVVTFAQLSQKLQGNLKARSLTLTALNTQALLDMSQAGVQSGFHEFPTLDPDAIEAAYSGFLN